VTGYSQRRALLLSDCLGNGGLERQLGLLAANIESPWTAEVLAIDGGVYEAWLREHGVRVRVCGRRGV